MNPRATHAALPLIEALLNGTIDDAGFARLEAVLYDDVEARALYRSMANLHATLPSILNQIPRLSIRLTDSDGESLLEPHEMPHDQLMALIAQVESNGEDLDPMVLAAERFPTEPKRSPTKQDWAMAGAYLLGQAKQYRQQMIMGLAAAVMLFAAVVVVIWSQADDPTGPIANVPAPDQPVEDAPAMPNAPVATLTAEHEAQWESDFDFGTPDLGDPFREGRSLTLMSGFAELTTAKDAVVLLEGPCKVAFDAGDNGLRLSEGRLVADVPLQAVGFTVNTPTARVVDYGTTFGVEVKQDGTTSAAVFVGEVELSEISDAPGRPTRNVRLTAGWSSSVSAAGRLNDTPEAMTPSKQVRFTKSLDDAASPGFAYRRAVLSSKPMVYWGFDEAQRKTKNLAHDDRWDGQAIGQVGHDTGLFGSALKLTGQIESMGGFASDNPMMLKDVTAYTLEAWCWIDQPHHGCVMALSAIDDTVERKLVGLGGLEVLPGQGLLGFLAGQENKLRFIHRFPVSDDFHTGQSHFSQKLVTPGQWMHFVAVKDADQAQLYINGELVQQEQDNQTVAPDKPVGLYIGVSPKMLIPEAVIASTDFRPFHGLIDEVAVYDTALSQETIRHHFSLAQPGTRPD